MGEQFGVVFVCDCDSGVVSVSVSRFEKLCLSKNASDNRRVDWYRE